MLTHRLSRTPTYQSWLDMVKRCSNPKAAHYSNYGGRGIKVHGSLRSFEGFLSVLGVRPEGMTLDRIDSNGDYEPNNVRWATRKEQNRNTRTNDMVSFNGRTVPLSQWAEELGVSQGTLWSRLYRDGMSVEDALTKPPNTTPGRKLTDEQISYIRQSPLRQIDLAKQFGVWQTTISRIRRGERWRTV